MTGGTGVLGTAVARQLENWGEDFLSVSRNPQPKRSYSDATARKHDAWMPVDLTTGKGLAEAMRNRNVVLHLASSVDKVNKEPMEVVAAHHLVAAARQAGVQHLVYVSIVGIDQIPLPYYKAKLAAEAIIRKSGIPFTILRATQFFPFIDFLIRGMMYFPVGFVPKKVLLQPVSIESVSEKLAALARSAPANEILNWGGPEILPLGELAKFWLENRARRKPIVNVPICGSVLNALASGAATQVPFDAKSSTWKQYLAR